MQLSAKNASHQLRMALSTIPILSHITQFFEDIFSEKNLIFQFHYQWWENQIECVNFIHERRNLQFNFDSEGQIVEKLFHSDFILLVTVFDRNLLRNRQWRNVFHITYFRDVWARREISQHTTYYITATSCICRQHSLTLSHCFEVQILRNWIALMPFNRQITKAPSIGPTLIFYIP